ncbi:MAG: hypothetical protein ACR2PM_19755 [Hyphomicrobiales bacterium]
MIYYGFFPYYYSLYSPFYNYYYSDAYYSDPYYYESIYYEGDSGPYYERLSCEEVREVLYDYGYTRVESYDCGGTVYGFYATNRGRSYRVRVSANNADILSRRLY